MRSRAKTEFTMCRRKNKYSVREGHKAVARVSTNGTEPHLYKCPFCGERHLGRNKKKFKKKVYGNQ